ncbi:Fatty acid amide hydrolase [Clonorchis sinensis]|uniref:Fatty acid amide hydrolase n=1 Tax=Clonorchis sinensis TaxID=79923 RepID=A0A8T1MS29_CLOSI|nr:Fatty acid amide hydrolase [Clonorchis sinensis]
MEFICINMAELIEMHWTMLVGWLAKRSVRRICISCGVTALMFHLIRRLYQQHRQNERLRKKQDSVKQNINAVRSQLAQANVTDDLLALTDLGLGELSQKIASGDVTPIQLLHAFQTKALQLYEKGNSGICEFVLQAQSVFEGSSIEEEQEEHLSTMRKSPLYGIPISLKETFCMKGYDSTGGLIKCCNSPMEEDCVLVTVLRKAGAIPFVRTTTSQAMRALDGTNPVFGDTTNPFNSSRIVGGSSGGEAALVAQRGAPVGIASDVGGSTRIPAAFCGLASLKPTVNRLSSLGCLNLARHSVLELQACPGPVARKVDDLAGVMRSLLTPVMFDLDPRVPPMPFNEEAYNGSSKKKLTIGFYRTFRDPCLMPAAAVVGEAINHAAATLGKAGHRIVRFKPPNPVKAYKLFLRCIFADGGWELRRLLSNEPVVPHLRFLNLVLSSPRWIKFTIDVFARFVGFGPVAVAHTMGGLRSAQAAIDLLVAVREYQKEFHKSWLEAGDLDAVVCPAFPYPAPPVDTRAMFVMPGIAYVSLYNLVDYPAGTVSTGFVDHVNIIESNKLAIDRHLEGDKYGSKIAAMQKGSEGLPIAVQVVGRPFQEETVLRVMRTIEEGAATRTG